MSSSKIGTVVPFLRKNLALWNVTNFKKSDNPHCMVSFTIPGLSHESFDIDANPKITSIMITSVLSRAFALNKPDTETGKSFLDWSDLTSGKYTFVSSTEFRMSQDLYNPDVAKWPLDAEFSLGNVGNSSVANVIKFYSSCSSETPLWTNLTQLVYIDSSSRKPTPLPDWFKDKYKGKGCMENGFIIKPFERPSVTYVLPMKVSWSDTDNYKHTNFASYVRFALDSLHSALRVELETTKSSNGNEVQPSVDCMVNGDKADDIESTKEQTISNGIVELNKPLQGISKEKIANGLKNVQICYLNESLEGQMLNVHIWQQPGQEYVVLCSIEREDKDICQIRLEYFDTPRQCGSCN